MCDRQPRGRVAVTVVAAATMRKVMASPASPFAISEASGIGIPKAPLPVGWRGTTGEVQGNAGGNRTAVPQVHAEKKFNSENNKFDLETFDLVSEYCTRFHLKTGTGTGRDAQN